MPNKKYADEILDLMFKAGRVVRSKMGSGSGEKVNWLQVHTLCFIAEHDGITMKELATQLMVTAPSATSFVDRLVRQKLVSRSADPKNRKLVRLGVTPAGKRLIHTKIRQKQGAMRGIISSLPVKDQRELARILASMLDSVSRSSS